jgi:hypothetical protein
LPVVIREFTVIQVRFPTARIACGRSVRKTSHLAEAGTSVTASEAYCRAGLNNGGRDDVVKLVTAYENGLYG